MTPTSLHNVPGITWRKEIARHFGVCVDARDYFAALYEVLLRAEHRIYIAGWDIAYGVNLRPDSPELSPNQCLGKLLYELLERNKNLEIYLLIWDFPTLYAPDREPKPFLLTHWKHHDRLQFKLDDAHPIGSCHHQKFVVVDEQMAFSGGLDLTRRRWDDSEHRPENTLRKHEGDAYLPFHDVQSAVEGPPARALADLFRERWRRYTRRELPPMPTASETSLWPPALPTLVSDYPVNISLTMPAYKKYLEMRHAEALTLESLRRARRYIYLENQYLTSHAVGRVLKDLLRAPHGPEVVLVLPQEKMSWLEGLSMGVLQNALIAELRRADRYARLGVFYPWKADLDGAPIVMHAKLSIIDDNFLRVGSANLNNRSMGLDTECDLWIEAVDDTAAQRQIAGQLHRMLAEHFAMRESEVATQLAQSPSVLNFIREHQNTQRCLKKLERRNPRWLKTFAVQAKVLDPDEPLEREQFIQNFMDEADAPAQSPKYIKILFYTAVALACFGLWKDAKTLEWREAYMINHSFGFLVLPSALLAGLGLIPPTVFLLFLFNILGPTHGLAWSLPTFFVMSLAHYAFGRFLPKTWVQKLVGRRLHGAGQKLARIGSLPEVVLRLLPVAPLTVINLVSGAEATPLKKFLKHSFLGILPILLALTFFEWIFEYLFKRWMLS